MSEYAKAVLELPVRPERAQAEREARRLFQKQTAELEDAIRHDTRLTPMQRLVGLEIAGRLNFKTGYSWPAQDTIANKVGCSKRTVQRATDLLADQETGLWFRRVLDEKNYVYHPRFERLKEPRQPVDNRRHLRRGTGDISGVANVTLSSLRESLEKENPGRACGAPIALPPDAHKPIGRMDDRSGKVIDLTNQDEIITAAARAEGNGQFVYYNSRAWRSWNDFYVRQGRPALSLGQTRRHVVNGVVRVGVDLPSVFPPGYSQYGVGTVVPSSSSSPIIECSPYLVENIRRRGVQRPRNQLQNKFDEDREPK
jgi:hypothetical protein